MTAPRETYEYAGFRFMIYRDINGKAVDMIPVEGQHVASRKDVHRRAALESYLTDAGHFDAVRDAITRTARAVAALPPVDLGPVESDPPHGVRAARLAKYLDEHPEVETTITTWKQRDSLNDFARRVWPAGSNEPLPVPPLQGHASEASLRAARMVRDASVFDVARGPTIGDESIPCPSCGTSTVIISLLHDEIISQCPSCSQRKAP